VASRANGIDTSSALLKYGYQVWLSADRQRFFLQGRRGQAVLADLIPNSCWSRLL
jgi:hypothetical protein